ncbi:hypothetical protein TTHERM_001576269 (macronuclear) [Tetrahymena thermophila SB210]|uniref:Kinase domain protein n=1 Tax=Tetrahymena thermophila (strain SB210) TaxID=312017 RepID=W7X297_TETTS|nr:hypothetical protein TTHERM_001576269 [Tetrahymena thermophila SB210]EWS73320.1 hypothetical protein TTHERM_001576269 [Tetrahymena thermophila SB210]|eukprot:XP_012654145.1 hypothetical protein TTHERM_001576269 [Tetrahymena thermophila SB210]
MNYFYLIKQRENKVGNEGSIALSEGLSKCQNLRELKLYINCIEITIEGYQKIDQCLSGLVNLLNFECFLLNQSELLKSQDILNCKNIKVISCFFPYKKTEFFLNRHINKAKKIKRLVKFIKN